MVSLLSPLRFYDQHWGALFEFKAVLSLNQELGSVFPGPCWGAGRAQKFEPNHVFGTLNILPMSGFLPLQSLPFNTFLNPDWNVCCVITDLAQV